MLTRVKLQKNKQKTRRDHWKQEFVFKNTRKGRRFTNILGFNHSVALKSPSMFQPNDLVYGVNEKF